MINLATVRIVWINKNMTMLVNFQLSRYLTLEFKKKIVHVFWEESFQGYGLTEDGKTGILLEANVTVISHETCTEYFRHNASTSDGAQIRRQLTNALPNGLTYGLLCAQGETLHSILNITA